MSISILSCAYRGLSAATHMSIVNAMGVLGWKHRIVSDDALLDHARGVLVSAWFRETTDSALLMIDDDIEFSPSEAAALMGRLNSPGVDIVSAVYPARLGQTLTGAPLDPNATWPEDNSLIELDRCGMGCLAVTRRAIQKMIESEELLDEGAISGSFWPLFMPFARNRRYIGEDTAFGVRAREAGLRIWLDPQVSVRHLSGELPVSQGNMLLVQAAYNSTAMQRGVAAAA